MRSRIMPSASNVVLKFKTRFDTRIYAKLSWTLPLGVTWHKGMVYSGPEFIYRARVEDVIYSSNGQVCVWLEEVYDEYSCGPDPAAHYYQHGWLPEELFKFEQERERERAAAERLRAAARARELMLMPKHYSLVTSPADRIAYLNSENDKSAFVDKSPEEPQQQETP
jgi:hypothetical protein